MDSPPSLPEIEMDPSSDLDVRPENPSVHDVDAWEKKFNHLNHEVLASAHSLWEISDWNAIPDRANGPIFECGGYTWRILLFPKGNTNSGDTFSLYCEVVPPEDADDQWAVCAQFILAIANTEEPEIHYSQQAHHRFHKGESDWGFSRMLDLKTAKTVSANYARPLIEGGAVTLALYVRVIKDSTGVLWHTFQNYDSKKATGYVGLLNQGATCYMNSLLQSLYFTNYFRKAVYQIPTKDDNPQNSVALAIQRVFLQLQNSHTSVGTNELTKSFGWDSIDSFMQHDVQEFNRVLQDNLEGKMKGTDAEGAIQRLFVGKMKSYITCINVHYESSRVEDYYDIQLNVKGCKGVHESFEKYIEVEFLDGDNKYMAEGHGLQDAKKGVIFDSFPPVLHLQLKRFDYDIMRDAMVKINDRYEFPESINLDEFLSEDADRSEPHDYVLHGVLVHSGDLHGGHYFALLRPTPSGKWYKFDDDRVTPVTDQEVYEENFGGDSTPQLTKDLTHTPGLRANHGRSLKRFSNAYMLVYIRRSKLGEILKEVTEEDIPEHLSQRLRNENAAHVLATKKRMEQDQQVTFQILTDESIRKHRGCGLGELSSPTSSHWSLQCNKSDTVQWLLEHIAHKLQLEPSQFRLWALSHRENRTVRPDALILPNHPPTANIDQNLLTMTLMQLKETKFNSHPPYGIYVETATCVLPFDKMFPEINDTSDAQLLLVKYFDRATQTLDYLGKFYATDNTRISDIVTKLNHMMGFPKDTQLTLYEEVKPNLIEEVNQRQSVGRADLTSGDIICFQLAEAPLPTEPVIGNGPESQEVDELEGGVRKMATNPSITNYGGGVLDYFEDLANHIQVTFKPKLNSGLRDANKQHSELKELTLELHRKMTYSALLGQLAQALGPQTDPLKIRLHAPNSIRSQITTPIPYSPQQPLEDLVRIPILPVQLQDLVVYYEPLDVPLPELESQVAREVVLIGNSLRDLAKHTFLVKKDGCVGDLICLLKEKVSSLAEAELRLYEADQSRFTRFLTDDVLIKDLYPVSSIYVEKKNSIHDVKEVKVFHFARDISRAHSIPFFLEVVPDESYDSLVDRLTQRLGVNNRETQKIKLALVKVPTQVYSAKSPSSLGTKVREAMMAVPTDFLSQSKAKKVESLVTYIESDDDWAKVDLSKNIYPVQEGVDDDVSDQQGQGEGDDKMRYELQLGLDHPDKTPKPSRFSERAIKIFN